MKKIPALDGLRGIAILLVFAFHYVPGGITSHSLPKRIVGALCGFGWSGVDLFFVLSGFLITGILWDTRSDPGYYKKFYARRALRIFPVFYLFAAILFPFGRWQLGHISFLLYVGFPVALIWPSLIHTPILVIHLWSLSAEEQFYLVWPSLIKKLRNPLKMCVWAIAGALILRILFVVSGYGVWVYWFVLTRVDALGVGAGIALLMRRGVEVRKFAAPVLVISSAALLAFCVLCGTSFETTVMHTAGFSFLAFGYGAVLVTALEYPYLFSLSILRTFGKYSYGIYLFHFPLRPCFAVLKPHLHLAYVPFCLAANLGIAALSFHLFEQPILNLKKYFVYGRLRDKSQIAMGRDLAPA